MVESVGQQGRRVVCSFEIRTLGGTLIVVTTPTGQIGHLVVEALLERTDSLRLVVRDPSRLPQELLGRVEVVEGSHNDPGVASRAFEDADAVFYVVPPDPATRNVRGLYRSFAEAGADAIIARGVPRIVAVSTLGQGYLREAGHLSAALEAEPLLEATGASSRTLRMPFFMDNLLTQVSAIREYGIVSMPNTGDRELLTVATPDIAAVAVDLLLDDSWDGQSSVPVVGPDHFTPLADMSAAQNDGIYDRQLREVDVVTPTTFRSWCESTLRPAFEA